LEGLHPGPTNGKKSLRRPKHSIIEVVEPEIEEDNIICFVVVSCIFSSCM
jgi:hypothetical protein